MILLYHYYYQIVLATWTYTYIHIHTHMFYIYIYIYIYICVYPHTHTHTHTLLASSYCITVHYCHYSTYMRLYSYYTNTYSIISTSTVQYCISSLIVSSISILLYHYNSHILYLFFSRAHNTFLGFLAGQGR